MKVTKAQVAALVKRSKDAWSFKRYIAAGFPIDDNHDRFASYVTGSCLRSRGLVAWSQRSFESQIDESDTSIGEDGRVK